MGNRDIRVEIGRIRPKKAFETAKDTYQTFMGLDVRYLEDPTKLEMFREEVGRYRWRYGNNEPMTNSRRRNKKILRKKETVTSREAMGDLRDMCYIAANYLSKIPKGVQQFLKYDGEEK